MSKRILSVAGLACMLALTACASHRKPPGPGPAERAMRSPKSKIGILFATFDADRDSKLTQAELDIGIQEAFAAADANHDGNISPLEFETFSKAKLGGNMSPPFRLDFDRDVDGRITPAEFRAELKAIAKNLDTDNDGILTKEELAKTSGGPPDGEPGRGPRADRPHGGGPDSGPGGESGGGPPPL